jgi:NAD(P)H-nitrite reductase large subunit
VQKDCPSQRAYIATEDGYINTSNIEDEEDQDADEEDGEVLGDEATASYRSIIIQRVLSSQVQQPEKLQRHNLFQIFFIISDH